MRTFACIASSTSLSQAARQLKLSTAAVSRRLDSLEARLGVRLVTRTSRLLRLTAEGRLYHQHCSRILSDLDEVEAALSQGRSAEAGVLRLAAPVSFGRRKLAPLIACFSQRHPGLQVQLMLSDDVDALARHEYDLVVQVGRPESADFVARRLLSAKRVICAAPGYFETHPKPEKPSDLVQHRAVVLERGGRLLDRWLFQTASGPRPYSVTPSLSSNNGEVVHAWLLDGMGLGLKSCWDVEEDLRSGRLIEVLGELCLETADIYAVYPDRRFLPTRTRLLMDFLVEALPKTTEADVAQSDARHISVDPIAA